MNNKHILIIFACGCFILGALIFAVFFSKNPVSLSSGAAIGAVLSSIGFFGFSFIQYKKKKNAN